MAWKPIRPVIVTPHARRFCVGVGGEFGEQQLGQVLLVGGRHRSAQSQVSLAERADLPCSRRRVRIRPAQSHGASGLLSQDPVPRGGVPQSGQVVANINPCSGQTNDRALCQCAGQYGSAPARQAGQYRDVARRGRARVRWKLRR